MAKKNLTPATKAAYVAGVLDGASLVIDHERRQIRCRSTHLAALRRVSDILRSEGITHSMSGVPQRTQQKYWNLSISSSEFDKAMKLYEPYMA